MRKPCVVALLVLVLTGCGEHASAPGLNWNGKLTDKIPEPVRTALEQAQEFELLSLDPKHRDELAPSEFLRRRVIGTTNVKDAATRNRLLGALDASVRADRKLSAKCFDPRHAIRVVREGKDFYLTICFHCGHVYYFVNNVHIGKYYFETDYSPLAVFDEILAAAGVQLAADGMLEDKLEAKSNHN